MKASTSRKTIVVFCLAASLFASPTFAQYVRTDLTSNQAGVAPNTSPDLQNAWGLVQLHTSPFWISDNMAGCSTLYDGAGQLLTFVVVAIPPSAQCGPSNGAPIGTPTGVVGNISPTATDFTVTENGHSGRAIFLFASLDGKITGWTPAVDGVGASHATIAVDRSSVGASYTGLAIATDPNGQTFLYAADDGPNRRVDVFDGSFNLVNVGTFADPGIPSNYAPYGIQEVNGQIWVTYTALNKAQDGFVDVFDTAGNLVRHFATHGPLHSPWGVALAPSDFGPMSGAILVSNNTSRGRINAFNRETGQFLGPLRDTNGNTIEIDQLWGLQFGHDGGPGTFHNQLFFTAGPNNYANGTFGVITDGN
jgi:uncharacterized protein (TIGR03118 family)